MGKPLKSVRKFAKKHLKSQIARRHKLKPMKNAIRRKQAALEEKRARLIEAEAEDEKKKKKIEDMDVDELMDASFFDDGDDESDDVEAASEDEESDSSLPQEEDFIDITPLDQEDELEVDGDDDDDDTAELNQKNENFRSEVEKHKRELEMLKAKDPEFYEFLKEYDNERLEFGESDEDAEELENDEREIVPDTSKQTDTTKQKQQKALSMTIVDAWCKAAKESLKPDAVQKFGVLTNLLNAFRSACHYGDGEELSLKYNIPSSHVFNKIMVFVLMEMDNLFRKQLHLDSGSQIGLQELQKISRWKTLKPYIKSYLGNALHILNQMTDNEMICFTIRRLKSSVTFLGAFPKLARKYLKTVLHFWGTGEAALPFIAFVFIRELAAHLGTDYLELCLKGIYRQFTANTKFVNSKTLPRVQFMANCVVELYGMDLGPSYHYAFTFIRQMAMILRGALTTKSKEAFRRVYCWQYVMSLDLWVRVVSAYSGKDDLQPLVYPLVQIIDGVAGLVPTARYFPLRWQCAVLLNRLAASTDTFIPVAPLLIDMLTFKELHKPPTGGVGNSIDFRVILKVPKPTLKTRGFHEECVSMVLQQLTEHLAQWSHFVAFPELALLPIVQLRRFMKDTKIDRFRRQVKQLVDQIERNIDFVTKRREGVSFSPKDTAAISTFLEEEKGANTPLSQYAKNLKQRAQEHWDNITELSAQVDDSEKTDIQRDVEDNDDNEGTAAFSKDWLPDGTQKSFSGTDNSTSSKGADDEDIVEELDLSSDEDSPIETEMHSDDGDDDDAEEASPSKQQKRKRNKNRKLDSQLRKKRTSKNGIIKEKSGKQVIENGNEKRIVKNKISKEKSGKQLIQTGKKKKKYRQQKGIL